MKGDSMIRLARSFILTAAIYGIAHLGASQKPATTPSTQPATPTAPQAGDAGGKATAPQDPNANATQGQVDALQKQFDTLTADLKKQQDSDFAMTLGIGSLIVNSGVTDYSNQSNVLQANNLGRATPQYLVGVSMRTLVPNFRNLGAAAKDCSGALVAEPKCELWRRRPWEGFLSIKFSPQSSQTINGFVLGGSYAIAKYLDVMIGYALSPVNEPAPGFRVAASQFVTQQQLLGLDMNFNPTAMLNGKQDAFDGFPITDSTGKLIYKGAPLEVHYRGGAVFGVSIPINFASVFGGKSQ
jgi:hypothetical protein